MRLTVALLLLLMASCATLPPRVGSWACVKSENQWHVVNGGFVLKPTCLEFHPNYVPSIHGAWRD